MSSVYLSGSKPSAPKPNLPPGPPPLPILGNILSLPPRGTPEFQHWLKHKDAYGPISRVTALGLTLIIIHDRDAAQYIMGKKAHKTSARPQLNFATLCGFESFLITHQYNETYRLHRRLVHAQMGTRSLSARFESVQEQETMYFLLNVLRRPEEAINHLKTLAAAIILKITYGYSIDRTGVDPLVELIEHAMEHLSLAFVPCSWIIDAIPAIDRLPEGFPGLPYRKTAREWKAVNEAAAEIPYAFVQRQMAKGSHRPSYVSNLLESDLKTRTEDEEAIKWTAVSLYAAGSDSTVAILTSVILALVMFPEVQVRAQEEIDRVTGSDAARLPTFSDREHMPYIDGIVKEAWRWNPVGPMGLTHKSEEDIIYKDYLIPKDAYLLPSLWWFLHDPKMYSDPEVFKPERYMAPLNEPDPGDLAFGYGRRACAGRYFADASVYVAVVQMLAVFRFEKLRNAQGREIEVKLEAIPGMVNKPKPFEFAVEPRSQRHVELLRRLEAEQGQEESDAGSLGVGST
ncbi:cytochrome P450 [Aspergillus carlsbadensis]|nr:cytochrome P450 [Aspergillus carlsbadensis]